ncbi:MAG: hypothetical protein R2788_03510 [Saprospiraceae bacterium]
MLSQLVVATAYRPNRKHQGLLHSTPASPWKALAMRVDKFKIQNKFYPTTKISCVSMVTLPQIIRCDPNPGNGEWAIQRLIVSIGNNRMDWRFEIYQIHPHPPKQAHFHK